MGQPKFNLPESVSEKHFFTRPGWSENGLKLPVNRIESKFLGVTFGAENTTIRECPGRPKALF